MENPLSRPSATHSPDCPYSHQRELPHTEGGEQLLTLGYAHGSVVRHIHGATSGSSLNKASRSRFNLYLTERNRILLARKRFGRWWGVAAFLGLLQTAEHLVRVRSPRQFRIALEGWWAGIRGETGAPGFLGKDPASDARSRQKMAGRR